MAALNELIQKIENSELRSQIQEAANKLAKQKKFGLVFEEHLPECTLLYDIPVRKGAKVSVRNEKVNETYTVLKITEGKALCLPKNSAEAVQFDVADLVTTAELGEPIYPCLQLLGEVCNAPDSQLWHTLIEADNYHALQLLEYLYAGMVDCIYIDPPYNTGAKDWKYNNDYVDATDEYRHSKWLSMMQKRLEIAKRILNPDNSVLIVTIDEKEYLHLGCLLEEIFSEAKIQMISITNNRAGTGRSYEFARVNEYAFFVRIGNAEILPEFEYGDEHKSVLWDVLRRSELANIRPKKKTQFFPIFIDDTTCKIHSVGDPITPDVDISTVTAPVGCTAVFPIRDDGIETSWSCKKEELLSRIEKGYIKVGKKTPDKPQKYSLSYIKTGAISDIETGKAKIEGYNKDGSIRAFYSDKKKKNPSTVLAEEKYNARTHGSNLLESIIGKRFNYPKSLYAVEDCLRFVVANKPNALIVDFFAGSGTTLHAVNLLNAEDNGKRRCIMVTNNEVSAEEAKSLSEQGFHPNDDKWKELGIARYVTWPRTVCSIEGYNVNGAPLEGNYIGSGIPMSDGFKANAVFFKLGFLDKTQVSLGMQFKELLSTLWMKAGATGKCPTTDSSIPKMHILPQNKMAILYDENYFNEFAERLAQYPEIEAVYLVTDYEPSFVSMTQTLKGKKTYQLYRDYLDNFRINAGRNGR